MDMDPLAMVLPQMIAEEVRTEHAASERDAAALRARRVVQAWRPMARSLRRP